MKRFKYKARDKKGVLVTGEVEARDEFTAAKLVRDEGLIVISIQKSSLGLGLMGGSEKVPFSEVTNFTRQLATMVNSGLLVTEALSILRTQANPTMQRIVLQILADVEAGHSLSSALAKHPSVFSKTYIALIKAGEKGGVMDQVLLRLSADMEKSEEMRGKIKGALIYPAIIVVGMIIVSFIMLVFVIPQLATLYEQFGKELPFTTRVLIGLSDFAVNYWPITLAVVVALGLFGLLFVKSEAGKKKIDAYMFRIPILGQLQRQIILADLTRTMGLMIGAGVQLLEGLAVTTEVVRNDVIKTALADVTKMVEKGFPLSFSFSRHPEAFPFILSQMVAVGEETGKTAEIMSKLSHIFEVEVDQKVKTLTSALEPIILVALGIGVAFLVITIILPIYNLTSSFNL
jgi:type IV pilus assembly protein PilC